MALLAHMNPIISYHFFLLWKISNLGSAGLLRGFVDLVIVLYDYDDAVVLKSNYRLPDSSHILQNSYSSLSFSSCYSAF